MVEAVMMMGGLGLVLGIALAIASKVFYVYVDPLILAVDEALPGANCGGCGMPGCTSNAEAIVAGKASPNSCVAAGPEVAEAIAAIMGVTIEAKEPDIARLGCTYGVQDADVKYIYSGLNDCRAAAYLSGGMKVCTIGCLGFGTCARACPFNAITMGPEGLPVVDEERCTGCGTCERVCPKHIITMSSVTRRIIREYTTEDCTTPCQRACPAGIDICEYIRQITLGNYLQAVQVIKERNPFPTVIGRICPRPCEQECRRQYVDEAVAINFLKRFAADYEKSQHQRILPYKAPATGRRVTVIGGGVQGLSAAFFSSRLGHETKVYEATSEPGGLLRSAIAFYRLPREILDWDIDGIREMGVTIETEKALGRDFDITGLLKDDETVFLATGGWDSRLGRGADAWQVQPIPHTHLLIDFIQHTDQITCGSKVVIVGGGKPALDAARKCQQGGASSVKLLFRENRDECDIDSDVVNTLKQEGIAIYFNTAISRLMGEENHLTEVEYIELDTRVAANMPVNTLLISSGRFPELIFSKIQPQAPEDEDGEISDDPHNGPLQWEAIETVKKPDNKDEFGLLAPGDDLTDYTAAIKAIAAGRRAAAAIHHVMYGKPIDHSPNVLTVETWVQNVDHVHHVIPSPRQIMPLGGPREMVMGEDMEKGFSKEVADQEAKRCLQCGLICYQKEKN
ncbi:MAG: RnfABCDGE type electron transport complex subunit B [Thermodesulfobacteriota bacterium]|nr:RnfABCDGE type electron transport complex subunit B [Thermodesulfobacteriota bacterium]